jgi:hypothetical protein
MEIYKVGENGETEESILAKTPPSKPMGVKVEPYQDPFLPDIVNPKITWVHNQEPDMIRNKNEVKYAIYRATTPDYSSVPGNYQQIDVVEIDAGVAPYYIDETIMLPGSYHNQNGTVVHYPVRYKVQAIDNGLTVTEKSSVLSDFDAIDAIRIITGGGHEEEQGDSPSGMVPMNSELPTKFALKQNYPNPFNPVTNIQYDVPQDVFVTLKVYDALGKEVSILVNDFKKAGSYILAFDASALPSGIYFYKIQAAGFTSIKRMVLVK